MNKLHSASTVNEDTYPLRRLESAREVLEPEATGNGYQVQRNTASFADTYVRPTRCVIVEYDESFGEVEHVAVEPPNESYRVTLAGALDALRRADSG